MSHNYYEKYQKDQERESQWGHSFPSYFTPPRRGAKPPCPNGCGNEAVREIKKLTRIEGLDARLFRRAKKVRKFYTCGHCFRIFQIKVEHRQRQASRTPSTSHN